ncbi:MAG: DUF4240 domain-containing protein [Alphaproteobacteria bacterium]|nr:DUF4240 domain-containing protein [Alphaproteobacteria bacterium]
MDKDIFWKLIEDAKRASGPSGDIAGSVSARLAELSDRHILRWEQIFLAYMKMSYKEKLWAAAYMMNGGCSDDGFDY